MGLLENFTQNRTYPTTTDSLVSEIDTVSSPPNTTSAGVTNPSQNVLIGCGLAILGNLLISVSLNLQKYTHVQNAESGGRRHYLKQPLWWLGLTLMGFGEIGNFSAYGFAPASLVAPLGTTTVVANMFIAVIFLKEKLRPEDLFGSALAVVGAFLLVNFSSKKELVLTADEIVQLLIQIAFLIYVGVEIVALIVLFVIKYRFKVVNVLVLLLITSLLASFTVISAKAVSSMIQITFRGQMQLLHPVFWVMVVIMLVTAVTQVKFLNQAMKVFDATTVVPTNFVFFTVSAIVAGIVFYKEFWGLGPLDIFMFLFGCMLSFVGVYFITAGRAMQGANEHVDSEDEEIDPSTGMEESQKVPASIFPSWLFSSVNQAEVQPRKSSRHSSRQHSIVSTTSEDKYPIVPREVPPDQEAPERDLSDKEPIAEKNSTVKSYGATEEQAPQHSTEKDKSVDKTSQ